MVERQVEDTHEVEEAQTPILENMVIGVPPVFEGLTKQLDKIVEQPLLGPKAVFPAGAYNGSRKEGKRELTGWQQALHTPGKMRLDDVYRRRSPIEGLRRSSQKTLWAHSEELWRSVQMLLRRTSI